MPFQKKVLNNQQTFFIINVIFFVIIAFYGWVKLHYGFNFIDEGYHMTESWRLAAGDHFLEDKLTGSLRHFTLINGLIFKIAPGITLLGFRKLQFVLTIISLLLFSYALYKFKDNYYWHLPLILSVFAFTGLDPVGMISNLYYQTYPHLFITLHLAFFISGLFQKSFFKRYMLLAISSLMLWCMSLSVLHMGVVILAPVFLYIFARKYGLGKVSFDFKDLIYSLAPFSICWIIFLGIYQEKYIINLITSAQLLLSTSFHTPQSLVQINWNVIKHIVVTCLFLLMILYGLKKIKFPVLLSLLCLFSAGMYYIIDTSLFGLITPYGHGWFSRPMWFSSFLISFLGIFWVSIIVRIASKREPDQVQMFAVILLLPATLAAVASSILSGLGALTVLHTSIPIIVALGYLILENKNIATKACPVKFLILCLLLVPFYSTVIWSDWKFTFFDVAPSQATVVIEKGFGRGIKTNLIYKSLYSWIGDAAERYTEQDDYVLSYVLSPMVHMITKRVPSLEDTYVCFEEVPLTHIEKAVEKMKTDKREPRMAFVFDRIIGLSPVSLKDDKKYSWFGQQLSFPSNDPISRYVSQNMYLLDQYKIADSIVVMCFVNNREDVEIANLERSLMDKPEDPDLYYKIGELFMQKGDVGKAITYYRKAVTLRPDHIQTLYKISVAYSERGEYANAIQYLKIIVELYPQGSDLYYNIACLYARQDMVDESITWLEKALEKGFANRALLQSDDDLKKIRELPEFKKLMERYHMNF